MCCPAVAQAAAILSLPLLLLLLLLPAVLHHVTTRCCQQGCCLYTPAQLIAMSGECHQRWVLLQLAAAALKRLALLRLRLLLHS
jgi:hypothetical protein